MRIVWRITRCLTSEILSYLSQRVTDDPRSLVGFPYFVNSGKQIVAYHSELTVLQFSSNIVAICPLI